MKMTGTVWVKLLRSYCRGIAIGQHHIRLIIQQLADSGSHPSGVARPPLIVNLKSSSNRPAQFL